MMGDDKQEADKARKEKVKWKHLRDEEQRQKMMLRLKDKLEEPEVAPELYDHDQAQNEKELINEAMKHIVLESPTKDKERSSPRPNKYQKYWDTSHSAKLSKIRKYDLTEFRYKNIHKNPQNILVFGGKLMEYLQKKNGTGSGGGLTTGGDNV
jgi:hypothetical protein